MADQTPQLTTTVTLSITSMGNAETALTQLLALAQSNSTDQAEIATMNTNLTAALAPLQAATQAANTYLASLQPAQGQ